MQAVVKRGTDLVVAEMPDPTPARGQVLLRTLACGICGSDLHALHHMPHLSALARRLGAKQPLDPARDLVFGHEFCAEVVDFGPDTAPTMKRGARVVAFPRARGPYGLETVGFSHRFPGAYGEFVCVEANMLLPAPENVSDAHAAMTEPFAVGAHAVARAKLDEHSVALVIGCGAVGLAVIAALKVKGFGPVIAADYSPMRRKTAEAMGADIVIDPAESSPFGLWAQFGVALSAQQRNDALLAGKQMKEAVIFECVGAPGMIQKIIEGAAPAAQIMVVGVCMEEDRFEPYAALTKQLSIGFSSAYTFDEFRETLDHIASGQINVAPVLTGAIGRSGVADAFKELQKPNAHVKIVIEARA